MTHLFAKSLAIATLGVSPFFGANGDVKNLSSATVNASRSSPCFPSSISGFETVEFPETHLATVRGRGNGTVAGYNAAPFELAVTVFIYEREADSKADDELKLALSEVLAAHPGAELATKGNGSVPLSGKPTAAHGGMFLWGERDTEYGSLLWLVPRPKHYVKLRATYKRVAGKETEAMGFAIQSINAVANALCNPE